jgi:hypothetical protein
VFDDGDPLAGMAAVPWSQLEHAYGEASNVPHLLSATRRARQATDDAVAELFHTIWHQGTVYSATVAAVPFIAAMAADDNIRGDVRSELVFLLFLIARVRVTTRYTNTSFAASTTACPTTSRLA